MFSFIMNQKTSNSHRKTLRENRKSYWGVHLILFWPVKKTNRHIEYYVHSSGSFYEIFLADPHLLFN